MRAFRQDKCRDIYAPTDSCHISPTEMVLSTQGQKTSPLKLYLGSIIATPEEKPTFKRVTLGIV